MITSGRKLTLAALAIPTQFGRHGFRREIQLHIRLPVQTTDPDADFGHWQEPSTDIQTASFPDPPRLLDDYLWRMVGQQQGHMRRTLDVPGNVMCPGQHGVQAIPEWFGIPGVIPFTNQRRLKREPV